jgi:hypothetical protein
LNSPSPAASSSPAPFISVPGISKSKGFVVGFHNFGAGTWIVDVIQSGRSFPAGTATVTAGGSYSQSFSTPPLVGALVDAYVIVCPNTGGSCEKSATVRVGA